MLGWQTKIGIKSQRKGKYGIFIYQLIENFANFNFDYDCFPKFFSSKLKSPEKALLTSKLFFLIIG